MHKQAKSTCNVFYANACNESRAYSFDNATPLISTPAHIKGQPGRSHTGQQSGHEIAWKSQ